MTPGRVLIVDDDVRSVGLARRHLELHGHEVGVVAGWAGALASTPAFRPDVVLLDWSAIEAGGLQALRRLRRPRPIGVILLGADSSELDIIAGLNGGADDFVAKPFLPRELVARVDAVLRRSSGPSVPPGRGRLSAGPVELDFERRGAEVRGRFVALTARELDLLAFFLRNPGRALRREELLEAVWGYTVGDTSTVTVHVRHLRVKIELEPSRPQLLRTVWSVGYRFDPPVADPGTSPLSAP